MIICNTIVTLVLRLEVRAVIVILRIVMIVVDSNSNIENSGVGSE